MEPLLNDAKEWAALFRDVGLIIGIPILIGVGVKLYKQQIETLKSQIESLKLTQYDKAHNIIDSQKQLFDLERDQFEAKINELAENRKELEKKLSELEASNSETQDVKDEISNIDFKLDALRSALLKIEDVLEEHDSAVIQLGKALVGKFNNINFRAVLSDEERELIENNQEWLHDPKAILLTLSEMRDQGKDNA